MFGVLVLLCVLRDLFLGEKHFHLSFFFFSYDILEPPFGCSYYFIVLIIDTLKET